MEENKNTKVVVGSFQKQSRFTKKRLIIFGLPILALLLVVGTSAYFYKASHKTEPKLACTETNKDLILRNMGLFDPSNPDRMKQFNGPIQEIQKLESYDKDINCLYPVTAYYIYFGEPDKAKSHFEKLKQAEAAGQALFSEFTYKVSQDEMQSQIDLLANRGKEIEQNALGF